MLDSVQHTDPAQNTPDVNPLRQQSLTHDLDRHCYGKRSWQQGRALGRSLTDGSGLAGSGVIPGRDPAGDRRRAGPRPCCAPSELPRFRVKDYRRQGVATPFGQVTVWLPCFRCAGCGATEAGVEWPSHARSTPKLDQLRAHLSALMTDRTATAVLVADAPG
jgi:hypothetical protein